MKPHTLAFALLLLLALATASVAWAQGSPSGPTNFPMVGITTGQTLQVNLVHFPPDPCNTVKIGFQNSSGKAVGPTKTATPAAGHAVSLAYSPTIAAGKREELLPTVVASPSGSTADGCVATVEVISSGATLVLVPGAVGYPPDPVFGMVGVTSLQTVRLNVVAFPPNPCIGTISFADTTGKQIGTSMQVDLNPGQATFLDLPGSSMRAEVRPAVTVASGACLASAEVYENQTAATAAYYPPNPCAPSAVSCIAF